MGLCVGAIVAAPVETGLDLEKGLVLTGVVVSWCPAREDGPGECWLGEYWRDGAAAAAVAAAELWDRRRFGSRREGDISSDEAKLSVNFVLKT